MPIRVLVVDDHSLSRRMLRDCLASDSRLAVVGEATNGIEGIELARSLRPHVVVMDISMPQMGGFEATRILKQEMPCVPVILVSALYPNMKILPEAQRAGAALFLDKGSVLEDLVPAIMHISGRP